MSRKGLQERGRLARFRPDHFITDDGACVLSDAQYADDLEEALRIALRKQALDRPEVLRRRVFRSLADYAPRGWHAEVLAAPVALVRKVQADLDAIDEMRRDDEARLRRTCRA